MRILHNNPPFVASTMLLVSLAISISDVQAAIVTADFGTGSSTIDFGLTGNTSVAQDTEFTLEFVDNGLIGYATLAVRSFDDDANNDGLAGDFRSDVTTEIRANSLGVSGNSSGEIDPRGEALQFELISTSGLNGLFLKGIDLTSFDVSSDPSATLNGSDLEIESSLIIGSDVTMFSTGFAFGNGDLLNIFNSLDDPPSGNDDFGLDGLVFEANVTAVPEANCLLLLSTIAIFRIVQSSLVRRKRSSESTLTCPPNFLK